MCYMSGFFFSAGILVGCCYRVLLPPKLVLTEQFARKRLVVVRQCTLQHQRIPIKILAAFTLLPISIFEIHEANTNITQRI
jgi:multisubunit Na+/H+ antiporter MnhE subunit